LNFSAFSQSPPLRLWPIKTQRSSVQPITKESLKKSFLGRIRPGKQQLLFGAELRGRKKSRTSWGNCEGALQRSARDSYDSLA